MAIGLETPNEQSTVTLLKGIAADVEDLIAQQISVARAEIKADVQKIAQAGVLLTLGGSGCLVAGVLWSFAIAHLLYWATSTTGIESTALPLWACYGVVALPMTIAAAILLYAGREKINAVQMVQTAEAAKENVTWKTGQRMP